MSRARKDIVFDWDGARRRLGEASRQHSQLDEARAEQVLLQRAAALARVPAGTQPAVETRLTLLVFGLGGQRCAIDTRYLLEVSTVPELTRLPGAPPELLGVYNLRGQILPVFDLRASFGAERAERTPAARLLVLGQELPELSLWVDTVFEMIGLAESAVFAAGAGSNEQADGYLHGVTRDAISVLDAERLLSDTGLRVGDAGGLNLAGGFEP